MPSSTHGDSQNLCFPSVCSHLTGSVESYDLGKPFHDPGGSDMATKRLVPGPSGSSGGRTFQAPHVVELAGAAPRKEVSYSLQSSNLWVLQRGFKSRCNPSQEIHSMFL